MLAALLVGCGEAPATPVGTPVDLKPELRATPTLRDVGPDAADFRAAFGSGRSRLVALTSPT